MGELIKRESIEEQFPTIKKGIEKAKNIFDSIHSFKDIENVFLKGSGLSRNTYKSYLEAVRQFYNFTNGLNPLQCTEKHVESFYDFLLEKGADTATASLRIAGLKKYFVRVKNVVPFYTSPFELMNDRLKRKLSFKKKGNRRTKYLTESEIKRLLGWLEGDKSPRAYENYCICFMLITSGLRASELLQLRWKDIQYFEGQWTATFIGKGSKESEQELFESAVKSCLILFQSVFGRKPQNGDYLFYSSKYDSPLDYTALYRRIKRIGMNARREGIVKREVVWSPHLFRHSYISLLYKKGMGLKAIQNKSRHAGIDMLVNTYIHDDDRASNYLKKVFS
jgi:integrase/recombinase XerD